MTSRRARTWAAVGVFVSAVAVGLWVRVHGMPDSRDEDRARAQAQFEREARGREKARFAEAVSRGLAPGELPSEVDMEIAGAPERVVIQYTFDAKLQEAVQEVFRSYRPDYGAFVAIDPETGRVLALVSYTDRAAAKVPGEPLALRATFPSASVFKVVTAAAAIAERNFSSETVIPFNGRSHTLYRGNVLKTQLTRWTRYVTLRQAFAQSVNTVFGRIGAHTVGAEQLKEYAGRFGFGRAIPFDLPVQAGRADIGEDAWELAEAAAGFTRETTMSPLQGALIAAAVVNEGVMMEPYAIESAHRQDGTELHRAVPGVMSYATDAVTALEIRDLMRETVSKGTSTKSFRGFFKGDLSLLDVGGKTGSLSGQDPPGKYDWFVGYADSGSRRVAVAALTIHGKYWKVKSSYIARKGFETYFKGRAGDRFAGPAAGR